MNRYPLWAYIGIAALLVIAAIYALPNLYGEQPAVQISSLKNTLKVNNDLVTQVNVLLKEAGTPDDVRASLEGNTLRIATKDTTQQLQIKDMLEARLNPDATNPNYSVALNLVPASPSWLSAIGAQPMYLGLDLRGGVHFLLQVDMKSALEKKLDASVGNIRTTLRDGNIRFMNIRRAGEKLRITFPDAASRESGQKLLASRAPELTLSTLPGTDILLAEYDESGMKELQEAVIRQNITTLSNRVNELGVSEPIVQQQGYDRIVVQLPGIQDTAKAKDILGRTATLELRLVDESIDPNSLTSLESIPPGVEAYPDYSDPRGVRYVAVKPDIILTGEHIIEASAKTDDEKAIGGQINLTFDRAGARIFREVTRNNKKKNMAIILYEKGQGEIVTNATIQDEIPNGAVRISGQMSLEEARERALLLRAGSLAAPMEIIEEKTVGPSLGAENIQMGIRATAAGLIIIAVFMIFYYHLFGLFSVAALLSNVLLLIAVLSIAQATLTLQGIAAIALTLGIAIDSNVLINERIREELRVGLSPQMAISEGYARAFDTILDSNVTTFIAGLALWIFGTGPIKSFAIVHCLGIITSMFSSIVVSRALANLVYGSRRSLKAISIGQIWKPTVEA